MSTKYRNSRDVPLDTIITRLNGLSDAVAGGRKSQEREFTMRIPAECDRDADIVIAEAAVRLTKLHDENEALRARVAELAEKIRDIAIDSPPSNNMQLIYRLACQQADQLERGEGDEALDNLRDYAPATYAAEKADITPLYTHPQPADGVPGQPTTGTGGVPLSREVERKALLRSAKQVYPPTTGAGGVPEELIESAYHYFRKLDSDYPEYSTVKHTEKSRFKEAVKKIFSQSTTPGNGEWVRCEDRLPTKADFWVWVYDPTDGEIFLALAIDLKRDCEDGWTDYTHWMPTGLKRPQPPARQEGA